SGSSSVGIPLPIWVGSMQTTTKNFQDGSFQYLSVSSHSECERSCNRLCETSYCQGDNFLDRLLTHFSNWVMILKRYTPRKFAGCIEKGRKQRKINKSYLAKYSTVQLFLIVPFPIAAPDLGNAPSFYP